LPKKFTARSLRWGQALHMQISYILVINRLANRARKYLCLVVVDLIPNIKRAEEHWNLAKWEKWGSSRVPPGAGEENGQVADGAGADGAGQPQQRERRSATDPRSRALPGWIGWRRRRLGLRREAAVADERRRGGGGGETSGRQHFGLRKGKEANRLKKKALRIVHFTHQTRFDWILMNFTNFFEFFKNRRNLPPQFCSARNTDCRSTLCSCVYSKLFYVNRFIQCSDNNLNTSNCFALVLT
jgi:hypothetical protein